MIVDNYNQVQKENDRKISRIRYPRQTFDDIIITPIKNRRRTGTCTEFPN